MFWLGLSLGQNPNFDRKLVLGAPLNSFFHAGYPRAHIDSARRGRQCGAIQTGQGFVLLCTGRKTIQLAHSALDRVWSPTWLRPQAPLQSSRTA